jgi:hypothetical protein
MSFCLRFIQVILSVITVITCTAGCFCIWAGIQVCEFRPLATLDLEIIGQLLIGFGAGVAALGLLGLLATCLDSRCLLTSFTSFDLVVGLFLLTFGAGVLYLRGRVGDVLQTGASCEDNTYFKYPNAAVVQADELMCTDECPCDLGAALHLQYRQLGVAVVLGSARNVEGCDPCSNYTSLQELGCASSEEVLQEYFNQDEQQYFALLNWLEDQFTCSGVCYTGTFYLFSDVNAGVPEDSCMSSLKKWVEYQLLIIGSVVLLLGLFLLSAVGLASYMCCHFREDKG